MQDYQGNSKNEKPDKDKHIEKVVTGEVISRPKPLGTKFKSVFFGGEFKDTLRFISAEVLLPALRNLMVDAVTRGAERAVYGDYGRRGGAPRQPNYGGRTVYNTPILRPRDPRERQMLPEQTSIIPARHRMTNDVVISSREDAELVLERMVDIINQFDVASLADLYELLGLPSNPVDNKWGWTFLSNVEISQTREGYVINLPAAEPL